MSTYSTNLALELIGTGEQAGTWGNTTNTNLGTLIEQAISGYVTQAVATGTDTTLTIPNGATGVARNMYIELTGTGGTNTNLVVPANKKLYFIYNNSTGAVTVKVSGQTGVSVAATEKKILVSNGTDIVEATSYITAINSSLTLTTLNATSANITTLSGTAVNYGSATISTGNLTFSSTGQRITGDFTNSTASSRLLFQSSTTNGLTTVGIIPNGTSTTAAFVVNNASDASNASFLQLLSLAAETRINSSYVGTGSYLPLAFYTGGSERMRLDTSGNLGIGTASPVSKLSVGGNPPSSGVLAGVSAANSISLALSDNTNNSLYVKHVASGAATFGTDSGGQLAFATNGFTERMRIDASGNVGIGTASPVTRLHVLDALSGGQLIVANSETNAAEKYGTFATQHYTNAQSPALGMAVQSNSTDNNILIGGALGEFNAATTVRFYTAANNTTVTGSERMRIDSSGNVGIGGTADANAKVMITGTYPVSSNSGRAMRIAGTIPSGTTDNFIGVASIQSTQAASFTLSNLFHFYAIQSTIGAGSAVTNQYGFFAQSSLTGATNNYGFYSDIASGSNRWNFYANGTAQNYFAGDVGIGRTPAASTRLTIKGQNNGSGNFSVYVENSTPTELFKIRDDGTFYTGLAGNSPYNLTTGSAANAFVDSDGILRRSTSSLRYKSDVADADHGLSDVLKLRSVTYRGKNDGDKTFGGLIAEEVHDAGLTEFVVYDKEGRPDALHYGNMVALLVKAVQELKAELEALKTA